MIFIRCHKCCVLNFLALHWLAELSKELLERVEADVFENGRIPRLLVVGVSAVQKTSNSPVKGYDRSKSVHLSKSCAMPALASCTSDILASLASGLIKKAVSSSLKV